MPTVREISLFLEELAPSRLAESWDNVGLLVGMDSNPVTKIMTCLTITPESADEAIRVGAELIVSHHPLPFRPVQRLTGSETGTRLLWNLIRAGVSIYSAHTAFDSAASGINQLALERLGMKGIVPLQSRPGEEEALGAGRVGEFAAPLALSKLCQLVKSTYGVAQLLVVGNDDAQILRVASACGSGGSFVGPAIDAKANALITGEANFHTCLEAHARQVALIQVGHFSSERFGIESLARVLQSQFPRVQVWACEDEFDPIRFC